MEVGGHRSIRLMTVTVVAMTMLVACQAGPPPPAGLGTPSVAAASASNVPSAPVVPNPTADAPSTAATVGAASPFTSDAYDPRIVDDAVEQFATALTAQYDGADPAALQR
jgi:hypothetical protein